MPAAKPKKVLEAVSVQNVDLLAASGVVVAGLVDAAKARRDWDLRFKGYRVQGYRVQGYRVIGF